MKVLKSLYGLFGKEDSKNSEEKKNQQEKKGRKYKAEAATSYADVSLSKLLSCECEMLNGVSNLN